MTPEGQHWGLWLAIRMVLGTVLIVAATYGGSRFALAVTLWLMLLCCELAAVQRGRP